MRQLKNTSEINVYFREQHHHVDMPTSDSLWLVVSPGGRWLWLPVMMSRVLSVVIFGGGPGCGCLFLFVFSIQMVSYVTSVERFSGYGRVL